MIAPTGTGHEGCSPIFLRSSITLTGSITALSPYFCALFGMLIRMPQIPNYPSRNEVASGPDSIIVPPQMQGPFQHDIGIDELGHANTG